MLSHSLRPGVLFSDENCHQLGAAGDVEAAVNAFDVRVDGVLGGYNEFEKSRAGRWWAGSGMREFGKKIVGGQNARCRESAGKAESLGMAEDSYFRVDGADLQSGKEIFLVLAAGSSEAAEEAA